MRTMLSVETEYVWRTTAGSDGVLGVDGAEDDSEDARARLRLLRRLTAVGVWERVGVLKRPESACMGVGRWGVMSFGLALLSGDIPERRWNVCQWKGQPDERAWRVWRVKCLPVQVADI